MSRKAWIGWGVVAAGVAFFYLFGTSILRAQMETALSTACGRPVTLRSVHITLPPGIRMNGIAVPTGPREGPSPLSIEEITGRLTAGDLVQGRMGLNLEVKKPKMIIVWTPQARALFSPAAFKSAAGPIKMPLARLRVEGGELTFVDETVTPAVSWNLRDLRMEIAADRGPGEYSVRLSARLDDDAGKASGGLKLEGSVLLGGGPVDAVLEVDHGQVRQLSPYLRRILGTAPTQGQAHLTSRITVHEGVLMSRNDIVASEIVFPQGERTTLDLEGNRLVDLLRDADGKIHLGFIVTGRLGEKLDWSDLATGAMREAMRQALNKGIQKILSQMQEGRSAGEVLQDTLDSLGR